MKYMQARFGRRMNSMWYKYTVLQQIHKTAGGCDALSERHHIIHKHTVLPADLQHPRGNAASLTQKTNECLIPRSIVRTSLQSGWEDEKRAIRALQDADHRNERWEMKCRTMAVSQTLMTFLPRQHFRTSFRWFCNVVAPIQRHFGENARRINDVQKLCCFGRRLWCLKCCLGR